MINHRKKFLLVIYGAIIFLNFNLVLLAKEEGQAAQSVVFVGGAKKAGLTPFPDDEGTRKIIKQTEIEREARRLAKQGRYEEALIKYQEALNPSLLNREEEKATALWGMMRIHQKQKKYQLALEELQWFLNANPRKKNYWDKKTELVGLIEADKKESTEPIYNAIKLIKENNKEVLPPEKYQSYTNGVASQIIQLYDYMGDLDGGIAFIDNIASSKNMHSSDRKNYLLIKQAFIKDKTNKTKGGATKALIESNYFIW